MCTRNGVIDREELRALLESTDSGSQYSLTVDDCFLHPEVGLACCVLHLKCTLVLPLLMCLFWLQHWLEDDDLDKVMRNYDENGDGGLLSASLYWECDFLGNIPSPYQSCCWLAHDLGVLECDGQYVQGSSSSRSSANWYVPSHA